MHWPNFQFCCRYLHQKMIEGDEIEIAQEKLVKAYPKFQPIRLQYNAIFKSILKSDNQKELLSIYGNLKVDKNTESIAKLTNIKYYLILVSVIFLVMILINSIYTLPTFQEFYLTMESPSFAEPEKVNIYWLVSSVVIFISGTIVFQFSSLINQILSSINPFQSSTFKKAILSKKVVRQLEKIDALFSSPLGSHINDFSDQENEFYRQIKKDNLNVVIELETLINEEYITLNKVINSRLSTLLTLVSFSILFSIYIFLSSLYTSIYSIGTII